MYSWQIRQGEPPQSPSNTAASNRWTVPLLSPQAEIPVELSDWLGRLCLLYGLPFSYLIPDEGMLPAESIRFFHIDPNWIGAMLDGAASIGRVTTHDLEHDQQFQDILYSLAIQESLAGAGETVQSRATEEAMQPQAAEKAAYPPTAEGETKTVQSQTEGAETEKAQPQARDGTEEAPPQTGGTTKSECRTGILLRSRLVAYWPGLRVKAFAQKQPAQDETELPLLRMERLSSDTLLCIFAGVFQRVEIHQPPESVHFGADREEAGYMAELRTLGDTPGEPIPGCRTAVPMRGGADGVVDVERLAGLLKNQLAQAAGYTGDFTSAEFAVQMIEGVDRCVFENNE